MQTQKITRLALLLSVGIVLNIIEFMLPPIPIPIPGVVFRLGLANIVVLILLYTDSFKEAFTIQILRIFLANTLSGRLLSVMFYNAILGGIFAILLMYIGKKARIFSVVGVSILGAFGHVIGQVIASMLILSLIKPFMFYLPILVLVSIPTGFFTGHVTKKYFQIMEDTL